MSNTQSYPLFIWVIVAVLLVVVVGYAINRKQGVRSIRFPGGAVEFEPVSDMSHPTGERVKFVISYDGAGSVTREGAATVYLAGEEVARLAIDDIRPFHTVSASVPRPGIYAYRVEQVETHLGNPVRRVRMVGDGKVNIVEGAAFRVVPVLEPVTGRWSASLEQVLSREERDKELKEFETEIFGEEED